LHPAAITRWHTRTLSSKQLQVAGLRQRAYVLRMYALILLRCEQPAMLEPVLSALLGAASPAAAAAAAAAAGGGFGNGAAAAALLNPYTSASGGAAMLALQHICSVELPEARSEIPADVEQLQQDMVVDDVSVAALLMQPAVMEAAGVITQDDYGQAVFNFPVRRVWLLRCVRGPGLSLQAQGAWHMGGGGLLLSSQPL
jgi:hypothetical protein